MMVSYCYFKKKNKREFGLFTRLEKSLRQETGEIRRPLYTTSHGGKKRRESSGHYTYSTIDRHTWHLRFIEEYSLKEQNFVRII